MSDIHETCMRADQEAPALVIGRQLLESSYLWDVLHYKIETRH